MLEPLKSQGVTRMEDSAMAIRAKFTAVPGRQFVIRREAFRRIQRALNDAGIQFAHRKVTVEVPEHLSQAKLAAGGAAAADLQQEEDDLAAQPGAAE